MKPSDIEGETRRLGAPKDWQEEKDGSCGGLPIRDAVMPSGRPVMFSMWTTSSEERLLILAGHPVMFCIHGVSHPVVSIGVGET